MKPMPEEQSSASIRQPFTSPHPEMEAQRPPRSAQFSPRAAGEGATQHSPGPSSKTHSEACPDARVPVHEPRSTQTPPAALQPGAAEVTSEAPHPSTPPSLVSLPALSQPDTVTHSNDADKATIPTAGHRAGRPDSLSMSLHPPETRPADDSPEPRTIYASALSGALRVRGLEARTRCSPYLARTLGYCAQT